jgi:AcrR family transcriptional regulator
MPAAASHDAETFARTHGLDGLIERERLPSGLDDLPEPLVEDSQRERILTSMARACAIKGFRTVTVADIVEPAGVSRATFYELFKDKDDCLQAAMEVSIADAMGRFVGVYSPDAPWATMVRECAAAFLALLASRPTFARLALVEAPATGGRSFELYAAGKRVLQALLDRGREGAVEERGIPSSAGRGALAGAESLIVGQIIAGNTRRLSELLLDVVYILTVPYLGQAEALRQSEEAERSLRQGRA